MSATTSLVMIIPATQRDTANAVSEALGHGPGTFRIALEDAQGVVTHYGNHAWASDEFMAVLDDAAQGTLPMPADGRTWEDWGLSDQAVWDMFAELTIEGQPIGEQCPCAFFAHVAGGSGLGMPVVEVP